MRVLLAIDDSKFSEAATKAVIQQMRPEQTEVCVFHVVEPPLLIASYYEGEIGTLAGAERQWHERAKNLVKTAEQLLSKAGFKVETAVAEGDARPAIIDHASKWKADMIVVGSQGRKGLVRFLMGSVAEYVARHAPCTVSIVRIPQVAERS